MTQPIPDWLAESTRRHNSYRPQNPPPPEPPSNKIPDWLSATQDREPRRDALPVTREGRALLFAQFETVTPRLLELVCEGYTLNNAIRELPPMHPKIDAGAYIRWLKKKPQLYELYKEAKEVRTEAWAGELLRHAEGKNADGSESMADTARSRLIVDTYKWLMSADNRKQYGDTKTIEMNTTISITAALAQAQGRVIEAQLVEDDDVDVIDATDYKQLTDGSGEDSDD